jgi:hypothetical protein
MSASDKSAFFGDRDERPTVGEVLAGLFLATGSELCARELVEAAAEIEARLSKQTIFQAMPQEVS